MNFFKGTGKNYNWLWKKKLLLRTEELKLYQDAKVCYICNNKKKIQKKFTKDKNYQKVRDHCHCTDNIET